jgi:hypothetical protein
MMRVPRAPLAVHGRRARETGLVPGVSLAPTQSINKGPESRVPRAAAGAGGGRLRRPGAIAGEERA